MQNNTLSKLWSSPDNIYEHNIIFHFDKITYICNTNISVNLYSGNPQFTIFMPEFLKEEYDHELIISMARESLKYDPQISNESSFIPIISKDINAVKSMVKGDYEYMVYTSKDIIQIFVSKDITKEDETIIELLGNNDRMELTEFDLTLWNLQNDQ